MILTKHTVNFGVVSFLVSSLFQTKINIAPHNPIDLDTSTIDCLFDAIQPLTFIDKQVVLRSITQVALK